MKIGYNSRIVDGGQKWFYFYASTCQDGATCWFMVPGNSETWSETIFDQPSPEHELYVGARTISLPETTVIKIMENELQ